MYFTFSRMAKLPANHLCIFRAECSIADSAPGIVDTDLHSALQMSD